MKTKVLMVCLGNICRSPLAEGILRDKVDPDKVFVDSAGTGGYHIGERPDKRSIAVALKHGIDIRNQRCRKFSSKDFDEFDRIFVMDKNNYADVLSKARTEADTLKTSLLLDVLDNVGQEVPDPYYGGEEGFEKVYSMIDRACTKIANDLHKED